jgi:hypothetical protein
VATKVSSASVGTRLSDPARHPSTATDDALEKLDSVGAETINVKRTKSKQYRLLTRVSRLLTK